MGTIGMSLLAEARIRGRIKGTLREVKKQ